MSLFFQSFKTSGSGVDKKMKGFKRICRKEIDGGSVINESQCLPPQFVEYVGMLIKKEGGPYMWPNVDIDSLEGISAAMESLLTLKDKDKGKKGRLLQILLQAVYNLMSLVESGNQKMLLVESKLEESMSHLQDAKTLAHNSLHTATFLQDKLDEFTHKNATLETALQGLQTRVREPRIKFGGLKKGQGIFLKTSNTQDKWVQIGCIEPTNLDLITLDRDDICIDSDLEQDFKVREIASLYPQIPEKYKNTPVYPLEELPPLPDQNSTRDEINKYATEINQWVQNTRQYIRQLERQKTDKVIIPAHNSTTNSQESQRIDTQTSYNVSRGDLSRKCASLHTNTPSYQSESLFTRSIADTLNTDSPVPAHPMQTTPPVSSLRITDTKMVLADIGVAPLHDFNRFMVWINSIIRWGDTSNLSESTLINLALKGLGEKGREIEGFTNTFPVFLQSCREKIFKVNSEIQMTRLITILPNESISSAARRIINYLAATHRSSINSIMRQAQVKMYENDDMYRELILAIVSAPVAEYMNLLVDRNTEFSKWIQILQLEVNRHIYTTPVADVHEQGQKLCQTIFPKYNKRWRADHNFKHNNRGPGYNTNNKKGAGKNGEWIPFHKVMEENKSLQETVKALRQQLKDANFIPCA